jgi:cytochrome c-type biogenesis protein CcmH
MKNRSVFNLRLSAFICGLVFCLWMPVWAGPVQEDPLDRAVLEIARDLRCAVCQNQPVSESNADLAKDMRQIIREQLVAGKSRAQIVDYFVARYGDYVLMKPPTERAGLPLWLAPPLVLAVLALLAWIFLRQRSHLPVAPTPPLSKSDQERVRAAREQNPGQKKNEKKKVRSAKPSPRGQKKDKQP